MYYPRVLVFSNNCFSKSNSNGRTLGSLFHGWPKENLAQFSIMCFDPDFELCHNYFQVKDGEALHAIIEGERAVTGTNVSRVSAARTVQRFRSGPSGKTALKMLIRNAIWDSRRWMGKRFNAWIEEYSPQVVVVQSGDAAFMLKLATSVAEKRNIPLVIYNTEGYIFFDHNYLSHHWSDFVAFPLFRRQYRKAFDKALNVSRHSVYLNGKLKDDYTRYHPHKATVIYNSSGLDFKPKERLSDPPKISYLGNLGIRRPEALVEVGEVLQSISPEYYIDVYGKACESDEKLLKSSPGVRYRGMVPYEQVIQVIYESEIVCHVEKNDPVLLRELRYAFSTKIADSICSGTDFVIYAPSNLACAVYAKETGGAWHADTKEGLREVFRTIMNGNNERLAVLKRARAIAKANHGLEANCEKFHEIINSVFKR